MIEIARIIQNQYNNNNKIVIIIRISVHGASANSLQGQVTNAHSA